MAAENEEAVYSTDDTNKINEQPEASTELPQAEVSSTPSDKPGSSFDEHEILVEQFKNYFRIAEALLTTLKRPKDVEICTNILSKVQRLNDSKLLEVKRSNNAFFRFYLKILKWTSDNQPLELYQRLYCHKDLDETITESRTWLEDNKSYMAFKLLKDGTNIIYAAISEDPSAGWQDGGLNILVTQGACSKK